MKFEKSKEKKKGFHITITDVTTGDTIIDVVKKVPPEIISDLLFGDDDEEEEEDDDE